MAIGCELGGGLSLSCNYEVSGIDRIYIGNHGDFSYAKNSGGTVTGITATSGATFYAFDFYENSAIGSSSLQIGSNQSRFLNQTFVFSTNVSDAAGIEVIDQLGLAKVDVIAVTKEGTVELFGETGGLRASALEGSTGGAAGEGGFTITLLGQAKSNKTYVESESIIP